MVSVAVVPDTTAVDDVVPDAPAVTVDPDALPLEEPAVMLKLPDWA